MQTAALKYIKEISQKQIGKFVFAIGRIPAKRTKNTSPISFLNPKDEEGFIKGVKIEIDQMFDDLGHVHFAKKGIRKILAK